MLITFYLKIKHPFCSIGLVFILPKRLLVFVTIIFKDEQESEQTKLTTGRSFVVDKLSSDEFGRQDIAFFIMEIFR